MRSGVMLPYMLSNRDQIDVVASLGDHFSDNRLRLWSGHSFAISQFDTFSYLAAKISHLSCGTAVSVYPAMSPLSLSAASRSLSLLTGRRPMIGIGEGPFEMRQLLGGNPALPEVSSPIDRIRAFTEGLELGDRISGSDRLYDIGLGVLGTEMASLAAEIADFAVCFLTPAGYLRDTIVPSLRTSKVQKAPTRLVVVVNAFVSAEGRIPEVMAYRACGPHLTSRHYVRMLNRAGLNINESQPYVSTKRILDSGLCYFGSFAEIADRIFSDFGELDDVEVVISCAGSAPYGELEMILEESIELAERLDAA